MNEPHSVVQLSCSALHGHGHALTNERVEIDVHFTREIGQLHVVTPAGVHQMTPIGQLRLKDVSSAEGFDQSER